MAADLLVFIRRLIFLTADFGCVTKKSCAPKISVIFLLARQPHQAPRSIMVQVLLLVGIVRVHVLYLNPKICKYEFFCTSQKLHISGPKNVSYDAQRCPIIVKSPSAPSAQATHQITYTHYEEVKSSCPDSQTLKNLF